MKRAPWVFFIALLILLGAALGWEVREIGDGSGDWTVISRRVVSPWQTSPKADSLSEAEASRFVRVTRWYCYGLAFKHSQHHQLQRQ
jgi:hypothetical protein